MSHALRISFILAAAFAFAAPASAQERSVSQSVVVQVPSAASLAFHVPAPEAEFAAASAFAVQANSQNIAFMVVGGAGLILGAVIGGDEGTIIMIAGGGVALWGLWRYLR